MRTNRNPLSRDATDLLTDHRALASLLSAATAPASGRELAGEDDAVLAFRYAHLGPAPRSRRSSMSATKLLVAKAVLAAVGVSGGGVALAAATGHMPAVTGGNSAAASSAAHATDSHSAGGQSANHPAASPSPSLRGLCQAYTAHAADNPGKALDNPAFSALITAAGGKTNVAGFCATTLAAKPGNAPTTHPTGKPSSMPTTANTTHPTGKPSSAPTAHPTGKPSTRP
ncbi:MAG TPA: hypothetical protein VH589_28105 [Trebonia sp.]|jgi:hypothetical protein